MKKHELKVLLNSSCLKFALLLSRYIHRLQVDVRFIKILYLKTGGEREYEIQQVICFSNYKSRLMCYLLFSSAHKAITLSRKLTKSFYICIIILTSGNIQVLKRWFYYLNHDFLFIYF